MPAGSLYRAIQRTGGLAPVVDMVNDMYEKQRQRKALTDFMNYYSKFNQNIQDLNGTTTKTETAANPLFNPNSILDEVGLNTNKSNPSLDLSNMTGEKKPSGVAALNPNFMAKVAVSAPTYQKQTETPIYSPEEKYNKAQNAYSDLLASVIPNVDKLNPQVLSLVQSLAGNQVNKLKPDEINWETIPAGSMKVGVDKYGKVRSQITNPKEASSKWQLESRPAGSGMLQDYRIDINTGKSVPVGSPYKDVKGAREDRKIAAQETKAGKVKSPDLSKEEGEIDRLQQEYDNISGYAAEQDTQGNYTNLETKQDKDGNDIHVYSIFNPITKKREWLTPKSVKELKKQIEAKISSLKTQRQSKVNRAYGVKGNNNTDSKKARPKIEY